MKKHYPKKINFTLAAFAVCFMLFLLAPSTSSLGGAPVMGGLAIAAGEETNIVYSVANGNGTYAVIAYFEPGTFDPGDAGRQRVESIIYLPYATLECDRTNLIIYKNGSALLQCTYRGS